ncbi:MAG: potassium channel family protein [Clostridium sp.]|nr:potassium channel family protein [Clostridium sp.]
MKLTQRQHLFYDVVISLLAFTAVILVIIDLSDSLLPWQIALDRFILSVFTFDYLTRLIISTNRYKFIRNNICDLIAIIPLHTFFRTFKIFRLPLLKLFKLPRLFAFLYRPLKKAKVFLNTNGFKYVVFITALLIVLGGILIHFAENMSLSDGIWWAFVTATTVGYGDISPHTFYGRIIAMILMLMGIGLIRTVTSTITSYFLRTKRRDVHCEALEMIREQLEHFSELSEEDVEEICRILRALKR